MINSFVSALIAIFFFGKATKETEEKTKCTSWWSVAIYGVLSVLVGVFFYKTYQVATIYNFVQIDPMRTYYDEKGKTKDYIEEIEITTNFSNGGVYKNELESAFDKASVYGERYGETGGVKYKIVMPIDSKLPLRWNREIPKEYLQELTVPKGTKHLYSVAFIASEIPSLIPFTLLWEEDPDQWLEHPDNPNMYVKLKVENLRDNEKTYVKAAKPFADEINEDNLPAGSEVFKDGTVIWELICDCYPDSLYEIGVQASFSGVLKGVDMNKLNFFTAADVSQVSYYISLNSPLPVKHLLIQADIPIEIAAQIDSTVVGTRGLHVDRGPILYAVKNGGAHLHIKLPTMANLQLIRSLILTTILTALVSLFGMSLYYCLRRAALNYRRRHTMTMAKLRRISLFRVKTYRTFLGLIFFGAIAFIGYWCWMLLNDCPIGISENYLDYYLYIIIPVVSILLLLIVVALIYRWAFTPVSTRPAGVEISENGEEMEDEEAPTIFEYETEESEEEEWKRLTEGMPDTDMIELAEQEEEEVLSQEEEKEENRDAD